ncbi:protein dehydration-induced [Sesamum angolense]|uniref:Protein dehydration-induced n=1 Tax=Sesamum angolense TaxID=2727404 RepID=A0AAE1W807_9LAMI|nr:protein dehydration-induced [Sesamum angolense]
MERCNLLETETLISSVEVTSMASDNLIPMEAPEPAQVLQNSERKAVFRIFPGNRNRKWEDEVIIHSSFFTFNFPFLHGFKHVYRGDEFEEEEETRPEFLCPFCAEDFDMVGLCCHIDEEHAVEAKNGGCKMSQAGSRAREPARNKARLELELLVSSSSSLLGAVEERKLSEEEQKEKAQRCKFVQGLLLSTFLDDNL